MKQSDLTPRCDELAREHRRIMAGHMAPGVAQDWIRLAQTLEREFRAAHLYGDELSKRLERYEIGGVPIPAPKGHIYGDPEAINRVLNMRSTLREIRSLIDNALATNAAPVPVETDAAPSGATVDGQTGAAP